jgi:hypothetical protein
MWDALRAQLLDAPDREPFDIAMVVGRDSPLSPWERAGVRGWRVAV